MLEMKFEGLNKVSNINEILNSCKVDPEHPHVYRTRCSISKHRKVFTSSGTKLYGMCELEIIKSKNKCVHLTVTKDKIGSAAFEVDDGIIKLR